MERGSGGRDDFGFGDPFAGFHRGFGRPRSLFPSLFGRDPFDDPFFTQPFGSMFGPSMFDQMWSATFHQQHDTNFIQDAPARNNSRGLTIRELDDEEHDEMSRDGEERSSGEPHVQEPDEQMEGGGGPHRRDRHSGRSNNALPSAEQSRGYGGSGGSSRTRIIPIS